MRLLIMVLAILIGAASLGWYDAFHLFVGLAALVVMIVACVVWQRRMRDMDEHLRDEQAEPEPKAFWRELLIGVLGGITALFLLACSFFIASFTSLFVWCYNCEQCLTEIEVLNHGQAYNRIVEIIDQRLSQPLSEACQHQLIEKKCRALIDLSENTSFTKDARVKLLQQALLQAKSIAKVDLINLTQEKLHLSEQSDLLEQVSAKNIQILNELHNLQLKYQETSQGLVVSLSDLLFESGKASLTSSAQADIKAFASSLLHNPSVHQIIVNGYTDSTGDPIFNKQLSQLRAQFVADLLIAQGIDSSLIIVNGFGQLDPIASNDSPSDRAKNRRVIISIS